MKQIEYKLYRYSFRDNIDIRAIKIEGLPYRYWVVEDIMSVTKSEGVRRRIKKQTISMLKYIDVGMYKIETPDGDIVLDDAFSYYFNNGKDMGRIPKRGLRLISESQVENLFSAKDGNVKEFKWWFKLTTGQMTIDEVIEAIKEEENNGA